MLTNNPDLETTSDLRNETTNRKRKRRDGHIIKLTGQVMIKSCGFLKDVLGLKGISEITGTLNILVPMEMHCGNVNIGRLPTLENVVLENNSLSAGLMGMADLMKIGGDVKIKGNNDLENLMGLNSLTTIGGVFMLLSNNV